jgi:leucine dehydrogenase
MKAIAAPVATRTGVPAGYDHEQLAVVSGERSGVTMAIAVHSTKLGPALGGARLWHYERDDEGVADALRLAEAMTYKAAAAGLDLGGGKGVICAPTVEAPDGELRRAIMHDFGDLVEWLDGRYITAEDVGTGTEDMAELATRTAHVTGMPVDHGGTGDPSPFTAMGVQAAMHAACRQAFGTRVLAGRRVAVVGLGHVGTRLARGLAADGAALLLSDVDESRRALAAELGAEWLEPEAAMLAPCDVLAPCAVGGAIHVGNVRGLQCRVVCGAANNQLADEALAESLAGRGILFAPDFIANAGGLINVYRELHSYSEERARSLALGIEETMRGVFEHAAEADTTPLAAARALAQQRLDAAA